jgi:molybdopterin molybdotransferase
MRDEHLFASLDEALDMLIERVRTLGTETVSIGEAGGRVLRCSVVSDIDYPRTDVSSMDGYCLDSGLSRGASPASPVTLPVNGKSTPGAVPPRAEPGTCVLITTGAPLAGGTDAVVRYEDVAEHREGTEVDTITLSAQVKPGEYVRKMGEVVRAGQAVLEPGRVVTPEVLGILASFAGGPCEVSLRPRAAVLATGDELVRAGADVPAYSIRDSNSPMLAGLLREAGCEVAWSEHAADTEDGIAADLDRCGDLDLVMISGGISGGRFDFVPGCLERIGAEIVMRGVKVKPGKPVLFALRGRTHYFGVPGNPVSAVVSFHMLIKPAVLAMMGRSDWLPVYIEAQAAGDFGKKSPYLSFAPGRLEPDLTVKPTRFLGSGDIMSLAGANVLVSVPAGARGVAAGERVRVYPIGDLKQGGDA